MKRVMAAQPAAILLAVWGLIVILAIAASPQPTLAGDEYAYWAMSFRDLYGIDPVKEDPLLQQVGVEAYHRIIAFIRTYFTDGVAAIRMTQILLYAGCALVIGRAVFRDVGAGWWRWGVALLLSSPFALYVSPVMPESWFFCIAGIAIVTLAQDAESRFAPVWALAAGVLAMQAIFFKPHAMALIAGLGVATLIVAALPPGKRLIRIALNFAGYLGGCLISIPLGFLLWQTDTLLGPLYQSIAGQGTGGGVPLLDIIPYVLAFSIAGALIAGPTIFVPIVCAISGRKLSLLDTVAGRVWIAALMAMGAAIVLASAFSVQASLGNPAESLRVHARYFAFYGVIAGVASLAFLLTNIEQMGALALRISVGIYAVVFALFVLWVLSAFKIFPWDNPWMVSFIPPGYRNWPSWQPPFDMSLILIMVLAIAIAVMIALPRRLGIAHVVFLGLFNIAGGVATLWFVNMLRDDTRQVFTEARAFSELTASSSKPNEGVIVLDDRYGRGAFALWGLQEPARVIVLPAGAPLTPAQIPADAPWVMMIQRYDVQVPYAQEIRGQRVRLLLREGARPRVVEGPPS